MSVVIKNGDLLKSGCGIIGHQVNCQGVMGSGIALQIKNQYPKVYGYYDEYCEREASSILLGDAQFVSVDGFYVANLFGQLNYGSGLQTDYKALGRSLIELEGFAISKGIENVGLPYLIGCDRAGGDWKIVEQIILDVFLDSPIKLELWRYR